MPPALSALVDKHLGAAFLPRLKMHVFGLAEDFWHDGKENLLEVKIKRREPSSISGAALHNRDAAQAFQAANTQVDPTHWHAEPGEVSEKMWGNGYVTPGGVVITGMLTKPLGLTKEMSVLDLSAGLGGRMRRTAEETGAYITGLEPDPAVAARGMQLSVRAGKGKHAAIAHYDPATLSLSRTYDCIIARETFYRVPDQRAFFAAIAKHTKAGGQIAFTDYIVDPEHRDHPAIAAWKGNEILAKPMGLVEMAEAWAQVGFNLRVHEDLTDFYKTEVMLGMKKLMDFLGSGVQPDKETSLAVLRRVETWRHRLAAMEAGMKFYRFYGTKS